MRPDADKHAERRRPERAADRRIFEGERGDRVQRREPGRDLQVGGAVAGGAGVRRAKQETARHDPEVREPDHGAEPAADDTVDPELSADRRRGTETEPPPALSREVHRPGYRVAGEGGRCARAAERASHSAHPETRARAVRQSGVCAAGGDLGIAHLQSARQSEIPAAGDGLRADPAERHPHRRAEETAAERSSGIPAPGYGAGSE